MRTTVILTRGTGDNEFDLWVKDSVLDLKLLYKDKFLAASYSNDNNRIEIIRSGVFEKNAIDTIIEHVNKIEGEIFILHHSISKKTPLFSWIENKTNKISYSTRTESDERINLDNLESNEFALNKLRNSLQKNTSLDFTSVIEYVWSLKKINQEKKKDIATRNKITKLLSSLLINSDVKIIAKIIDELPENKVFTKEELNASIKIIKKEKDEKQFEHLFSEFKSKVKRGFNLIQKVEEGEQI